MVSDEVWQRVTARRAFALSRAAFSAALAARPGATELEDLFLATAALAGDPSAHKELVALIHSGRGAAARLVSGDEALLDDVEQEVARVVLTGPAPKLHEYSATGPLAAWLVSLLGCVATFVVSAALLVHVMDQGVSSYRLGGWDPSARKFYKTDELSFTVPRGMFLDMLKRYPESFLKMHTWETTRKKIDRSRKAWGEEVGT